MDDPLLMLPGALCDVRLFDPQFNHFIQLSVQMGEYGEVDNVAAMAWMVLGRAPPRFALMGLSLGGIVAQEIMRQAPQRVTRLALLDTNPDPATAEQMQARRDEIELVRSGGERAMMELMENQYWPLYVADAHRRDDRLRGLVLEMARLAGPDTLCRQWRAIADKPDGRASLADIRCPTLIMCGAEDGLCTPDTHRRMARAIAGARLVILPGCGHLSTLEAPQQVNEHLSAWLSA